MSIVVERATKMGFGSKLRTLREAAGLTQSALGDRIGTPYQNIARLERGDREPSWGTLLKLADALGVDLNAFRYPDDQPDDEPDPPVRDEGKRK